MTSSVRPVVDILEIEMSSQEIYRAADNIYTISSVYRAFTIGF
jgi:hypothetical protein